MDILFLMESMWPKHFHLFFLEVKFYAYMMNCIAEQCCKYQLRSINICSAIMLNLKYGVIQKISNKVSVQSW